MAELIKSVADSPWLLVYACPMAFLFGVVHTFLPGHGKTIVCGYYVGRKRDIAKILFVTAVTVSTHLFSSVLLGVLAMTSSQILVRNIILPKIKIAAASILIVFGFVMLAFGLRKGKKHAHGHGHGHSHGRLDSMLKEYVAADRVPIHHYARLFWLGMAAGLIPCLEPFTLMLFAIALDRLLLGFALLLSFGAGVFFTMVALAMLVTSEELSSERDSDNMFFRAAAKAASAFKVVYPVIIIILGSGWIYVTLTR